MARCIECSRFSLQAAQPEWQRQGYGCCVLHIPAMKYEARKDRDCGEFDVLPAEQIRKRESRLGRVMRGEA